MGGAFVAATIVSLVQFLRVGDRRLLLVAAMFACQSQALSRAWYDVWRDVFQAGVCAAGLALMLMLSRRPTHDTGPRAEDAVLAPGPAAPVAQVALPKD
jgi:hypothetical protein